MKNQILSVFLLASITFVIGCSSTPNYKLLNSNAKTLVEQGEDLIKQGKAGEGIKLILTARSLHPDDPRIKAILKNVPEKDQYFLEENPLLGFNKSKRVKVEPTTTERVLWYIPDRILDSIDMISVNVNSGPQLGVGAWATRAIQGVIYTGSYAGVGYFQKKNIGGISESSFDIVIGPFGVTALYGARAGTGGIDTTARALLFHKPGHPLYQEYRDYWAIGGKFGFVIVGAEAEYHPVEIYDFILGFATLDPMNDDMATTRRLRLDSSQEALLKQTLNMMSDAGEEGLLEYKRQFPSLDGK